MVPPIFPNDPVYITQFIFQGATNISVLINVFYCIQICCLFLISYHGKWSKSCYKVLEKFPVDGVSTP